MGLQVSTTSPGWPQPELPDPSFNPILAPIEHSGSQAVTPSEAEIGKPADLGTPGASLGYENSGDVIDTATFTEADVDPTECEEPPYEPVYPPTDDEPPEYGDPPSDWNPPEEIPDPQEPIPEPIYITVKGDDATLCINEAGATIPATQTVTPSQYANLFDPPTNGYNGNVGTYPVVPGQFHDPDDGNTYIVTSENGTLTVEYCDPDYDILCDVAMVADGKHDEQYRYYKTQATYPRYDCSQLNPQSYEPTQAFYMTPIHSYIAVAIKLQVREGRTDRGDRKWFKISYYDSLGELQEMSASADANDVTTEYCIYAEVDYNQSYKAKIVTSYMNDEEWSKSFPFEITVEETNEAGIPFYGYKKTFNVNHVYHTCPLHQHDQPHYKRCLHEWVLTNNPSILWAGTAEPGN